MQKSQWAHGAAGCRECIPASSRAATADPPSSTADGDRNAAVSAAECLQPVTAACWTARRQLGVAIQSFASCHACAAALHSAATAAGAASSHTRAAAFHSTAYTAQSWCPSGRHRYAEQRQLLDSRRADDVHLGRRLHMHHDRLVLSAAAASPRQCAATVWQVSLLGDQPAAELRQAQRHHHDAQGHHTQWHHAQGNHHHAQGYQHDAQRNQDVAPRH
jgi:hypothetical protein